jgi:UDP-glucuronate 4-epimerase
VKVLVTGGAGFIGSHLGEALLERGEQVVVLDNFNDYYSPARKRRNVAGMVEHPDFRLYEADIRNGEALAEVFAQERPDRVVHIAAMAGIRYSVQEPKLYEEVNVGGTLLVLEQARRHGVRSLVLASSSSVYGADCQAPFREDSPCARPISPYAATKRAAEILAYTYHHLYGLPVTCLRFFTVYGPRGRPDMAPYRFTDGIYRGESLQLYGDGSFVRDYTYIDDIVAGVLAALDAAFPYEIINLGNSHTITIADYIALIERVVGKKATIVRLPPAAGDVPLTHADISKARRLLGFDPQTPVAEGMERFFAWYRKEVAGE